MELLRFILGVGFIFMGLLVFCIQLIGVYKFKYILNRMHAAGMGDTMGISLCLVGAMFLFGWSYTSFKIAMIIAFLWLASPVSSHLISRLEVTTNENLEEYCELRFAEGELSKMHILPEEEQDIWKQHNDSKQTLAHKKAVNVRKKRSLINSEKNLKSVSQMEKESPS